MGRRREFSPVRLAALVVLAGVLAAALVFAGHGTDAGRVWGSLPSFGLFGAPDPPNQDGLAGQAAEEAPTQDGDGALSEQDLEALRNSCTFDGASSVVYNGDKPLFARRTTDAYAGVRFSEFDALGRCGTAWGTLGPQTLAKEERGPIGDVTPSGWHTVRYDDLVEGKYLYNRCHLIGYQLCADNDDPRNLITGTRFLNVEAMLPLENKVCDYIERTGNHVLYRVTPIFCGGDLVASGVLMEAFSVEDEGAGLLFCRYLFNVQPGVAIDYATGESWEDASVVVDGLARMVEPEVADGSDADAAPPDAFHTSADVPAGVTYVLNVNSMKFHKPDCPSVADMEQSNRRDFYGSREEALAMGYDPCGRCEP